MTAECTPPLPGVLDPDQLRRIESTHGGFLYQHLYVVGCLLLAQRAGVREVLVERDEDVELRFESAHVYIQVKTRSERLVQGDINGVLDRFATLRQAHADRLATDPAKAASEPALEAASRATSASPQRGGTATFVVISNVGPGPRLAAALDHPSWPSDVTVLWPGCTTPVPCGLAPAWPSIIDAVTWCTEHATVPYSRITPATLVWKLAALAQAAATGGVRGAAESHVFRVAELPEAFEQVVRSIQEISEPPVPYYPHQHEPNTLSDTAADATVRLLVGPTGAGKTSWAASRAVHDPRPLAYFSAEVGGTAFASALAQELAARFTEGVPGELSSVLMPGSSGTDALRALSVTLRARGVAPVVVIDDVHRLGADDILHAVAAAPGFRWVLLAHPGPVVGQIEARLGAASVRLEGWSLETIATVLRDTGCAADAATCDRVRSLTAGLPLFVRNVAQLAREQHAGDVRALCAQLEAGVHLQQTAQEILLTSTLAALAITSRRTADLLSMARVPLAAEEVARLAEAAGLAATATRIALRDLMAWGVARPAPQGRVQLHDAFKLLCDGSSLEAGHYDAALRALCDLLDPANGGFALDRGARYLELLPLVGRTDRLIYLASNEGEQLLELGMARHVTRVLEATAGNVYATPEDRFWSLDTLAFFALHAGRVGDATSRVDAMEQLVSTASVGGRAGQALLVKRLLLAGIAGDASAARDAYDAIVIASGDDHQLQRIARYNLAYALFRAGSFDEAAAEAWGLGQAYYDLLGLDPMRVFRASAAQVIAMLPDQDEVLPDIKRLADTLDLYTRARTELGREYGLAKLHAFKFYTICHAYQSAMKTGQDAVDDMIRMGDPAGARAFLEQTLLPSVEALRLVDHIVPLGGQYAVVLAYCGDIAAARSEMQRLMVFGEATSAEQRLELQNQVALVDAIAVDMEGPASDRHRRRRTVANGAPAPRHARRVRPNDPCPCGSGVKFKRCCGG